MTAAEMARDIVDEFALFEDWEERYQYLIDLGRKLPELEESYKVEANRLRGCQSLVHFKAEFEDPFLHFRAGSDAAIVQGLIALLLRVYSGREPGDILATPTDFLEEIGLHEHLSPTRRNGLASLVGAIRAAAERTPT